jgi:hypothetical protein
MEKRKNPMIQTMRMKYSVSIKRPTMKVVKEAIVAYNLTTIFAPLTKYIMVGILGTSKKNENKMVQKRAGPLPYIILVHQIF